MCCGTGPVRRSGSSGGSSPSSATARSSTWRSWPSPRCAAAPRRRTSCPCTRRRSRPGLRRPPSRPPSPSPGPAGDGYRSADAVTADQIREWAFSAWCALADTAKYLRRGSLWEAHDKLHAARHQIWALWAAAEGALYPWHGLSQVLDHDPGRLPPDIEATVAVLDAADLRRAARASAAALSAVSEAAARRPPGLPDAMARYVTGLLGERPAPGPP